MITHLKMVMISTIWFMMTWMVMTMMMTAIKTMTASATHPPFVAKYRMPPPMRFWTPDHWQCTLDHHRHDLQHHHHHNHHHPHHHCNHLHHHYNHHHQITLEMVMTIAGSNGFARYGKYFVLTTQLGKCVIRIAYVCILHIHVYHVFIWYNRCLSEQASQSMIRLPQNPS